MLCWVTPHAIIVEENDRGLGRQFDTYDLRVRRDHRFNPVLAIPLYNVNDQVV